VPFVEMNESRRKMARLPQGAYPVRNPIGGAPGVVTVVDPTTFVSLPGVPEELVAIVDQSLDAVFASIFQTAHYEERTLAVDLHDESAIADILAGVEAAHPAVYVKSRAKVIGEGITLRITLSARGDDPAGVDELLRAPAAELTRRITAAGFGVRPEEPEG
jgi:molybdopterin-biosynthesis enzyme MoeA-like protein